ncbi:LysE family transporter [Klebsiella sp. T2.Ur]|nr:LysE family transporter [Klebsiella sp. T2.Ur]
MEISLIASFWIVSFLLIITPGADWAYAISAGINGRRVVPAVMGLMSGHLLATIIVVAGVGVLIAGHPLALSAITLAGAAQQSAGSWNAWAVKGLCISGLNPKVFLLFLALLPQFTDPHGSWPLALQMSALGAMHLMTCTLIYLLVGYGARAVLAARPQAAKGVSMVSGLIMIAIAIILFYQQLR